MLKTVTGASAPQAKQVNLADLPSVDRLLGLPSVSLLIAEHGREPVLKATRQLLAEARAGLLSGKQQMTDWSEAAFSDRLGRDLAAAMRPPRASCRAPMRCAWQRRSLRPWRPVILPP